MRILRALLAILIAIPFVGLGVFYFKQDDVIFHPQPDRIAPSVDYIEVEDIPTEDGEHLVAWYWPPAPGCPVMLFMHGNASRLDRDQARYDHIRAHGYGLLAPAWRGYAGSSGKPSEKGLHLDAKAAWNWLVAQGYAPDGIVLHGYSIGSGPAVRLASEVDAGALVLESPFYSMKALVALRSGFLPADLVLRHPLRSDKYIADVHEPLLIAHGGQDKLIPPAESRRLFDAANEPKTYRLFDTAGHNSLPADGLYEEAVWPFLDPLYPNCQTTGFTEVQQP